MAKRNYQRMTTPRGVFIYPRLTEPDKKFVKPDGEYHTKFALDSDDAADMITRLNEIMEAYIDEELPLIEERAEEAKPNKKKKARRKAEKAAERDINEIYEEEIDDEGEDTGRLVFKFKLKAVVKTETKQWDQKPRLFDAHADAIEGDISIWTGTEGKCNLEIFPYYMEKDAVWGLSLRLKGAQILKLVEGGGASAEDMGFGAEDEGYVRDDAGTPEDDAPFSDEDGDGDDDDF